MSNKINRQQVVKTLSPYLPSFLSRRRQSLLTGSALLLFAASSLPVSAQTQTTIVDETFRNSTAFGWTTNGQFSGPSAGMSNAGPSFACLTATGSSPANSIHNCAGAPDQSGQGALRLTTAVTNEQSYAFYQFPIPSNTPLTISFDTFVYGGMTSDSGPNGADGISFFLSDASSTLTTPGGFGGSLGYAQRMNGSTVDPGIAKGYVGVGIDEYGNFRDDDESRGNGCGSGNYTAYTKSTQPQQPNTVTVRGPGDGTLGYCYIASQPTSGLTVGGRTGNSQGKHIVITYTPINSNTSQINVSVDGQQIITNATVTGQIPSKFLLGFASSTGDLTNLHEIQNLRITAQNPPLPNLTISKTHTPNNLLAGGTGTYTISLKNTGAADTTGPTTITDTLPPGFSFVSTNSPNWFCTASGQVVTCTYNLIISANGPAPDLVLNVNVANTTAPGTYTNTVTVPQDGVNTPPASTATDQTPVVGPISAAKSVNDLNGLNGGNAKAGDILEYTININNNTDIAANNVTFRDTIPANTTYVPNSTTLNGTAVADTNGTMPFVNGGSVNSPGLSSGQVGAGQVATVKFRVQINTPLPSNVTQVSNSGTVTSDRGNISTNAPTNTAPAPTIVPVNSLPSNLRLVKRITNATRNGSPISGINFGNFVSVDANDTAAGWPSGFLLGVAQIGTDTPLQSGDETEYTVYFLSDGGNPVNNFKFCDLIPSGTTFSPDSFGSSRGILLNLAGTSTPQTNASDADAGTYFAPLAPLPDGNTCSNKNNPDGAVIVNLANLSNAAGSNYGFVRFRVQIK